MADPAEFAPHELDRIEDALESLEFAPAHDDAAPMVRRRLDDYRSILALSRQAMPMVEVPRGLLDGVLAQARAAADAPAVAAAPSLAPERPSFWSRLRKAALIPGVALAGTAALVLVMVQGERSESVATAPAPARTDEAQPASAAAPTPTVTESSRGVRFQASEGEAQDAAAQRPGVAGSATPEPTAAPAAPVTTTPRELEQKLEEAPQEELSADDLAPSKKSAEKVPPVADEQQRKPADGDPPRWDIIARGDRARHRGDCESARSEYSLALGDADARVQARAHAGLGLCDAMGGDRKSADAAYKLARDLDGEIASFIDTERPKAPASSSKAKAKPAKPQSKNAKIDAAE